MCIQARQFRESSHCQPAISLADDSIRIRDPVLLPLSPFMRRILAGVVRNKFCSKSAFRLRPRILQAITRLPEQICFYFLYAVLTIILITRAPRGAQTSPLGEPGQSGHYSFKPPPEL